MSTPAYIVHNEALSLFYHNMDQLVQDCQNTDNQLVMFGSSQISGMIIDYLEKKSLFVDAIIDNNPTRKDKTVYGKRVYTPEEYLKGNVHNVIVLIASSHENEMKEQLYSLGCEDQNIRVVLPLKTVMNDYSHVNRKNMTELNVEEIKQYQVSTIKALRELCADNGLRYYLSSGTLLGAVRHKGYIPWDDDVDIFVPIDDLLKLEQILSTNSRYRIISQFNENIYLGCGQAYMVDLSILSDVNKFPIQLTTGHSIDIFPLFGLPEDPQQIQEYITKTKELECQCLNNMDQQKNYEQAVQTLNDWLLQYTYNASNTVGNVLMPGFYKDVFSKEIFGDGCNVEFEGEIYRAPSQCETYLTHIYGDYMTPPPESKRVSAHYYHSYHAKVEL